jgi:hypothetical protein
MYCCHGIAAKPRADHLRHADHHYWRIFVHLFAFADEYNFPQLRGDIMTIAIALDCARRSQYGKGIAIIKIQAMCDMLPTSSTLYTYIAKSYAFYVSFDNEEKYANYPAPFLVKVLRNCAPIFSKDIAASGGELRDPCSFHEHDGELDNTQCRERQRKDGVFYNSFLTVCMQGVYEYDKRDAPRVDQKKANGVKIEESMAS